MCYYCRYLAHEKSIAHLNICSSYNDVKTSSSSSNRSCHLLAMTLFFVLLNVTIVLCQSSQIQQQQRDQSSSKILERYSQGNDQLTSFPGLKTHENLISLERKSIFHYLDGDRQFPESFFSLLLPLLSELRLSPVELSQISFFLKNSICMKETEQSNPLDEMKNLSKHLCHFLRRFLILISRFFLD